MVKGTYAGTDWDQNSYESYIHRSIEKLELMKRKPVRVDTGMYRTWFEPKAVADFIDMFSWNGISEASLQQGCSGFGKMRHNFFSKTLMEPRLCRASRPKLMFNTT